MMINASIKIQSHHIFSICVAVFTSVGLLLVGVSANITTEQRAIYKFINTIVFWSLSIIWPLYRT